MAIKERQEGELNIQRVMGYNFFKKNMHFCLSISILSLKQTEQHFIMTSLFAIKPVLGFRVFKGLRG